MESHRTMMRHTYVIKNTLKMIAALLVTSAFAAATPPVPATPAPALKLVEARPFTLEKGFAHAWRQEKPSVRAGWILVLKVDPDLVYPRQTAEPVLYVGRETAERVNVGYASGHVIAIVGAKPNDDGTPGLDLAKIPIWFGDPELPERVDAARIDREHARAVAAGIGTVPPKQVKAALTRGGGRTIALSDRNELMREAARLVRQYSPQERELADNWLLPVTP